SPTEWPTTKSGVMPHSFNAASTARLVATRAGCCTSVSTSSSSGASKQRRTRSSPVARPARWKTSMAAGTASAISRPMPGSSEPCPGKQKATLLIAIPPSCRNPFCPFEEARAPGEAGAHAGHQYELALLQSPVGGRVRQCERNRSRRCVAKAVDVDHDAILRDAEPLDGMVDDTDIRLVRDVDVDVLHAHPATGEELF